MEGITFSYFDDFQAQGRYCMPILIPLMYYLTMGLKYMIEPSFFYGAMYVSYALTVALAVAIFVIGYIFNLSLISSLISTLVILILLTPITMRISRLLYINMFVHYQEKRN